MIFNNDEVLVGPQLAPLLNGAMEPSLTQYGGIRMSSEWEGPAQHLARRDCSEECSVVFFPPAWVPSGDHGVWRERERLD